MLELRCSSLPLADLCGQSVIPPRDRVEWMADPDESPADLGSAAHELFLGRLTGQNPDPAEVARKWRVDRAKLEKLVGLTHWACKRPLPNGQTIAEIFSGADAEVAMQAEADGWRLTGSADLANQVGDQVRVLDLKTGWLDIDCEPQVKGYCFLALRNCDATEAYGAVLRPRWMRFDVWRWSRAELETWWSDLLAAVRQEVYTAGEHCRRCKRWHECPAGRQWLANAAQSILDEAIGGDVLKPDAKRLLTIHAQLGAVEKACKQVRAMVKVEVALRGGKVEDESGTLELVKRGVKSFKWPESEAILRETLGDRLPECLTVSKGVVEDEVRSRVGHGMKGKAVTELMDRLEAAGAIETTYQERLEFRRHKTPKDAPQLEGAK